MRVFTLHRGLEVAIGNDVVVRAEPMPGHKVKLFIQCPQDVRTKTSRTNRDDKAAPPCSNAPPTI